MIVNGIVVRGHGKSFIIRSGGQEFSCEIRGKIKYWADSTTPVAVGDDVVISTNRDGSGMIEVVEKRRSMFCRPAKGSNQDKQIIAANIDQLAVVASVKQPTLKPGLIDRFLISAQLGNLKSLVIINKIDLGRIPLLDDLQKAYSDIGIPNYAISAITGEGLDLLEPALAEHRTIFAGHSGVGKSTILNHLIPGLNLKVGDVSEHTNRGIHATSSIELFELPHGGYVVDSPGLKVLGLWELQKKGLDRYFPELCRFADNCRFAGCCHIPEPDCAVKNAVKDGLIPEFRYKGYVTIYNSLS